LPAQVMQIVSRDRKDRVTGSLKTTWQQNVITL
jgi:hypothetical protein